MELYMLDFVKRLLYNVFEIHAVTACISICLFTLLNGIVLYGYPMFWSSNAFQMENPMRYSISPLMNI